MTRLLKSTFRNPEMMNLPMLYLEPVSPKILKSGIIQKTFTHAVVDCSVG